MHDGNSLMQSYFSIFNEGYTNVKTYVCIILLIFFFVNNFKRKVKIVKEMDYRLTGATKIEIMNLNHCSVFV